MRASLFFVLMMIGPALAFCPEASAGLTTGHLLVSDPLAVGGQAAIISVDPSTGEQTVISSGGLLRFPSGIAIDRLGNIFVADRWTNAIVHVDADTGEQIIVSSGQYFVEPINVAIEDDNSLIVVDADAFGGTGGVIRVDLSTGTQSPVSSGGNFIVPIGLALDSDGDIIVGDRGPQAVGSDGFLLRINPTTGSQSVIAAGGWIWNPDHLERVEKATS